jgi:uncharacterized membrane protein YhhN
MDILWQYSGWAFCLALIVAGLDWLAIARRQRRLEYILKPATLALVLVAAWLLTQGPHDAWLARFFLPGLIFSLAGDILLLLPNERFFIPGLAAFLLAHVCYIVGLNSTLPPWPALLLFIVVAIIGLALFRGIALGLRHHQQTAMLVPVALYSLILSLMLFSAWATLFRPEWTPLRRGMVIAGASLFFASDTMLARNLFVTLSSSPSARLRVMITYHLGQIALAASIASIG